MPGPDVAGYDDLDLGWLRSKPGQKWTKARHLGPEGLAAWVADMDFPPPPSVRAALHAAVDFGDLGYPEAEVERGAVADAFAERMRARYAWTPDASHVHLFTDVVQATQVALHLGSEAGDGVVLQTPSYPPFLATLERMRPRCAAGRPGHRAAMGVRPRPDDGGRRAGGAGPPAGQPAQPDGAGPGPGRARGGRPCRRRPRPARHRR